MLEQRRGYLKAIVGVESRSFFPVYSVGIDRALTLATGAADNTTVKSYIVPRRRTRGK